MEGRAAEGVGVKGVGFAAGSGCAAEGVDVEGVKGVGGAVSCGRAAEGEGVVGRCEGYGRCS